MNDANVRYNQIRQKSSHNSYQRKEGYPTQALYWRIRSMEIDIHSGNNGSGWPQLNSDWYVYHASVIDQGTTVNTLCDALDALKAFHQAVPNHEVITIWLDLKDDFDSNRNQTPESLDRLISDTLGRDNIWGPSDLIGSSSNLQAAVASHQWPPLKSLQGKFIFGCTTGNLSSPNSVLNQYVDNGATASQRLCFVAPEITKPSDLLNHNYAVMFNLSSSHTTLAQDVFNAGFISRAYGLNSQSRWSRGWSSNANHLGTDKVNTFTDKWARTDLPETGYPFTGIDASLDSDLTEPGQLFAINVNSGDIWNSKDSFYFQYDEFDNTSNNVLTAFTANPQSHVNNFIKGGLMARSSIADDSAYIAVFQTGDNKIRIQYRGNDGDNSHKIDAMIPHGVNGKSVVSNNTPIWLRLDIQSDGKRGVASYSINGSEWIRIGQVSVNSTLNLQGWAAASHNDGEIKWLFGGMDAPSLGQAIGSEASGRFINESGEAASLGPYQSNFK
ncbi:Ca2+-dependent phosphoinositide-specific phospholipase C [Photobacterium alginatilyticum]|uniref:Phosphatidylinositol diacylglycerol-lyase n=1 Tax=Photobacterium alginatilyticum TaxID=1775171 RepID=A0ABW9YDP0_9GAMM|nr:Ca2+-dependent phosphoinositide-specific phospholipase C [Photobacterium alginatilyticum]NBI51879.1 hypothetical protein [Photobacterium alginatilyticum]